MIESPKSLSENLPTDSLFQSDKGFRIDSRMRIRIADLPVAARPLSPSPEAYRQTAREQMLAHRSAGTIGFRDHHGYIVDYEDGHPTILGEATLHTAIAIIALATGSYHLDGWEAAQANMMMEELLQTVLDRSWGNRDGFGIDHPIRHPDVFDYDQAGSRLRNSPMTKDSFNALVAAAFYAFDCPHSSERVRSLARELMSKWSQYLVLHAWRTHSNYLSGEFEQDGKHYKHIFSAPENENRRVKYKGPESFTLLPHEVYALKNCCARVGLMTAGWNVWSLDLPEGFEQMLLEIAATYLADAAAQALDAILRQLGWSIPYSIPLGMPEWGWKVEGVFSVRIPADVRERTVAAFRDNLLGLARAALRLEALLSDQLDELLGLAVDKILDFLPSELGTDQWRAVLTTALNQVTPWLDGTVWVEVAAFSAALAFLRLAPEPDVVSYSLWAYAVQFETRPEMADILKPLVQPFYGFIRSHGNPNGLWAWLAEDSGRVQDQLHIIQEKELGWKRFAYGSTPFNEWVDKQARTEPNDPESPRLDFLILDGLAEKGPPRALSDVVATWFQLFRDMVQNAWRRFVEWVGNQFEQAGAYTREVFDQAGNLIRETWSKAGAYTQAQIANGILTLQRTWNGAGELIERLALQLDGTWVEEYWGRTGERYWKGIWDKVGEGGTMVSRFLERLDGVWSEEYWGRTGERYWKGIWDKVGEGGTMVSRFLEDLDGVWSEEYWGRAGERYWKGVWDKVGEGGTMVSRFLENLDGVWSEEYWRRAGERYWKGIWTRLGEGGTMVSRFLEKLDGVWSEEYWRRAGERYWKGTWTKLGEGGTMVSRFLENLDGLWSEEYWRRAGERYWKGIWTRLGDSGTMISRFLENLEGVWSEEYWGRAGERYWRGVWNKLGDGARMIERYVVDPVGAITAETWDAAGRYSKAAWNAAGDLIEQIGSWIPKPNWLPW